MAPLFSIITVTRQAQATVEPTLASVDGQTCRLYEHLIMDGASTDSTVPLCNAAGNPLRRVVSEPDHGLYDAMNKGIRLAQGDYVMFLNAGDRLHSPHTLQQLADAIMADDYPGVVYGQTDIVDADGRRIGPRHLTAPEVLTFDSFKQGMVVCHQAFVVLRRLAYPFDLRYRFSADYEWCLRVLQHSRRNAYVPDVIIDYLEGGLTQANHRASLIERYKIMCRYYGAVPTTLRHIGFFFRNLRRR